jgi:predicted  nucleic acid-binding Zn-ribbon protein
MAKSNSNAHPPRQSLCCVRFSIFILLAAFSAASIYLYKIVTSLQDKISTYESTITSLQQSVNSQQYIINRCSQSVTNADVQSKITELEQSLHDTETHMFSSLDKRTIHIQTLLKATVNSLAATVQAAQTDIQTEVAVIKGDIDQYIQTT